MTMDFVPFRPRVGAMRRPVGQRRPRFATVTLSSPHRYRPLLLLLLSVLAAPKKQICDGGRSSGTWSQYLCRSARWPASAGTVALHVRTATFHLARGPLFEQEVSIPVLNVFNGVSNLPEIGSVSPR